MPKNNNTLLLFKNFSKLSSDNYYLSVVPVSNEIKNKFKIKEIDFVLPQKNEILENYNCCDRIYKKLLKKILKLLNEIHNVNFNEREIEIIIGYWLKNYIYLSFKIFKQLEFVFEKEQIDNVLTTEHTGFNFVKENTLEFAEAHALDLKWYYCFFSKIIDYFNNDFSKNTIIKKIGDDEKPRKILRQKTKLTDKFLYFVQGKLKNSNNAFISHTYLSFLEEKKLEFLFHQLPNYYKSLDIKNDIPINFDLRKKYSTIERNDEKNFENFLLTNIFNFLPKSFLENFKENIKLSETDFFPKNPKFIFTSSLNFFDEIFKVYAALQLKNNKPIFIGQHGNNYFSRIHNNYLPEFNYATKFLSWGYESSNFKNVTGLFNFKTVKQNFTNKIQPKKKLVIFFDFLSNVSDNLFYSPGEILKSLSRIEMFLKGIRKEIKNNVILRMNNSFYQKTYGLSYFNYFNNFEVEVDNGQKSQHKILREAKLCIFNYDSTGFLENSCNNLPSIMFFGKDYLNFINDDFIRKYKDLHKENIIFYDDLLLSNHINQIWDNIEGWWNSRLVQNSLKKFNHKHNVKGDNKSLSLIMSTIKKNL